jgi:two-component system, NtrC family, sensor histidine kinase HydH
MAFSGSSRWLRWIRPHDWVWLFLFGLLIFNPIYGDAFELGPLIALGIVQIAEPKVPGLQTTRGRVAGILLKLVLIWPLLAFNGTVGSRYWVLLSLPVVSAATMAGVGWTLLWTIVVAGAYLSFLLFPAVNWSEWVDLAVERVVFLAMVGTLANMLAEDLRVQSTKHQRTARELAQANVQLQEAEEAVRRSDRLAALGQLSAGLAHELRNPLGTIRASSEMLEQSMAAENEVAREVAGFIRTEVDRCNALITRFLQFARPVELQREKVDLGKILDQAITLVEREAPGIAIYRNYEPELRPFPFDVTLMERVFYNLILNAAQASSPGGAVTVKTRSAAGTAEVAVIDRGAGIQPGNLNNIFNPFFTTKPSGVGLGLAIVSKIVDEHGGKITVESEPGKGSIFRVALPMEPAAPQSSS